MAKVDALPPAAASWCGLRAGTAALRALLLLALLLAPAIPARAQTEQPDTAAAPDEPFVVGDLLRDYLPDWKGPADTPISQEELKSLFCIGTGASVGAVSVLFSGTAAAVAGLAQATLVALPALAAAMWAGCALGAAAAPGLVWLARNGDRLF